MSGKKGWLARALVGRWVGGSKYVDVDVGFFWVRGWAIRYGFPTEYEGRGVGRENWDRERHDGGFLPIFSLLFFFLQARNWFLLPMAEFSCRKEGGGSGRKTCTFSNSVGSSSSVLFYYI